MHRNLIPTEQVAFIKRKVWKMIAITYKCYIPLVNIERYN